MKNIFLFIASVASVANAHPNYHKIAEIPIKGKGGWDMLQVDPASHRLFVSHSDRVVVIDTEKNEVMKEIEGTTGVHGIAVATGLGKAYSSNGKDNSVSVIDLKTLDVKAKIPVGENPDAIVYDPETNEVYAFNGHGKSASVIDAKTDKVTTIIPLEGKPEFAVVDTKAPRIYVNIEDKNAVSVIDTRKHKVILDWKLTGCESPSGIALNERMHHLFSTCDGKMVMTDTRNGRVLDSASTGDGTDGAAYDPQLKLAFSPNGRSGTITILEEKSSRKLGEVQTVKSEVGARTIVLDPTTHRIYLPTADFQPAKDGKRPKPVDGTQKVLVFGI